MRIQEIQHGLLLATLLLVSLAVAARGDTFFANAPRAAFVSRTQGQSLHVPGQWQQHQLSVRGGATLFVDDDDDEEEESEDEEEEEAEEEESSTLDASLAAAAVRSTQKAKSKAQSSKTSSVKKTMSAKLSKPQKNSSLLKLLHVPYILRAIFNPFTVASMTKHFWISLVNLDYPPKVSWKKKKESQPSRHGSILFRT